MNTVAATPAARGFESAFGYWSGAEDHTAHTTASGLYDFSLQGVQQTQYAGNWSTHVFTDAAIDIINNFGTGGPRSGTPMFLYLAYQDVHW